MFGNFLENMHDHMNIDNDEVIEEDENEGAPQSQDEGDTKNDTNVSKTNSDPQLYAEYEEHSVDQFENMDFGDIDDIANFADSAATRLATQT